HLWSGAFFFFGVRRFSAALVFWREKPKRRKSAALQKRKAPHSKQRTAPSTGSTMVAKTHTLKRPSSQRTEAAPQLARQIQENASPSVRFVPHLMEAVVLGCVTLAPWAFGAAEPAFEFLLNGAVCLLLVLWGLRILLEWRFVWRKCPVVLCLAGLFLT